MEKPEKLQIAKSRLNNQRDRCNSQSSRGQRQRDRSRAQGLQKSTYTANTELTQSVHRAQTISHLGCWRGVVYVGSERQMRTINADSSGEGQLQMNQDRKWFSK